MSRPVSKRLPMKVVSAFHGPFAIRFATSLPTNSTIWASKLSKTSLGLRVFALRAEAIANLPAAGSGPAISIQLPPIAARLSIVVLPFANLSDDKEQQYFADGITEDLTTDLSRIPDMLVISRNTAFTYRDKPVETKQIGRELGVRYVLEGSVRRLRNQIRINAQLIDSETDVHLWADRFDCDADDLFAMQNEITSRIAVALNLELVGTEARRPTDRPDALEFILWGRAKWSTPALCRGNRSIREGLSARSPIF